MFGKWLDCSVEDLPHGAAGTRSCHFGLSDFFFFNKYEFSFPAISLLYLMGIPLSLSCCCSLSYLLCSGTTCWSSPSTGLWSSPCPVMWRGRWVTTTGKNEAQTWSKLNTQQSVLQGCIVCIMLVWGFRGLVLACSQEFPLPVTVFPLLWEVENTNLDMERSKLIQKVHFPKQKFLCWSRGEYGHCFVTERKLFLCLSVLNHQLSWFCLTICTNTGQFLVESRVFFAQDSLFTP